MTSESCSQISEISADIFTMQAAYSNTKVVAFLREPGRNIWFLPRNESFHCFGVPGFYLQENFELILIKTKHKSHYSGELGSLAGVDAVMHSRDGTARTQEEMSTGMIFRLQHQHLFSTELFSLSL